MEKTIAEELNEQFVPRETLTEMSPVEEVAPQPAGIDLSFLKAKTGAGSISDYLQHPLNPTENKGVAQALRGFTGMFDSLDYAIIDVVMGLFQLLKKKEPKDYGANLY